MTSHISYSSVLEPAWHANQVESLLRGKLDHKKQHIRRALFLLFTPYSPTTLHHHAPYHPRTLRHIRTCCCKGSSRSESRLLCVLSHLSLTLRAFITSSCRRSVLKIALTRRSGATFSLVRKDTSRESLVLVWTTCSKFCPGRWYE